MSANTTINLNELYLKQPDGTYVLVKTNYPLLFSAALEHPFAIASPENSDSQTVFLASVAGGPGSIAIGNGCRADGVDNNGERCIALAAGKNCISIDKRAFSWGNGAKSYANCSISFGQVIENYGPVSLMVAKNSTNNAEESLIVGDNIINYGIDAFVLGGSNNEPITNYARYSVIAGEKLAIGSQDMQMHGHSIVTGETIGLAVISHSAVFGYYHYNPTKKIQNSLLAGSLCEIIVDDNEFYQGMLLGWGLQGKSGQVWLGTFNKTERDLDQNHPFIINNEEILFGIGNGRSSEDRDNGLLLSKQGTLFVNKIITSALQANQAIIANHSFSQDKVSLDFKDFFDFNITNNQVEIIKASGNIKKSKVNIDTEVNINNTLMATSGKFTDIEVKNGIVANKVKVNGNDYNIQILDHIPSDSELQSDTITLVIAKS